MTNDYYSKDTIDAKLDSIHETLLRIEAQTIKTNGRVTTIEMDNASRTGSTKVWTIIVSFITSLAIAIGAALLTRK